MNLPDFLCELLDHPPKAGNGVHRWLYCVSRQLHAHMPAGEIVAVLRERTRTCGRPVPHGEIVAAVKDALATAWHPTLRQSYSSQHQPTWPKADGQAQSAILS